MTFGGESGDWYAIANGELGEIFIIALSSSQILEFHLIIITMKT